MNDQHSSHDVKFSAPEGLRVSIPSAPPAAERDELRVRSLPAANAGAAYRIKGPAKKKKKPGKKRPGKKAPGKKRAPSKKRR